MKKILIISEQDMTAVKLITLYHAIYGHTSKEFILCTIELTKCYSGGIALPLHQPTNTFIKDVMNPAKKYLTQSKPKKIITVKNCNKIIDIIKREGIRTVLIPNFLYDSDRAKQLTEIVKKIKRIGNIEVIGVYV